MSNKKDSKNIIISKLDVTENVANKLIFANKELAFQNLEKEDRASELLLANKELAYQNDEKEKRANELAIANKELAFQNNEKEKRANELIIANKELAFQNDEKEKRANELAIANKELAFQNNEKEKRAAELVIANKELAFQNDEKEKRASELVIANKELDFQNNEKEKRAAELVIANQELFFQNQEKEKRAAELLIANKELESFTFVSSHDLQEPLRKIQSFSNRLLAEEFDNLSEKGKYYLERTRISALHMQTLINDLLAYSRTSASERKFVKSNLDTVVKEVLDTIKDELLQKNAIVEYNNLGFALIIPFQFKQMLQNILLNSLKFSKPNINPHIIIINVNQKNNEVSDVLFPKDINYCHMSITDNGIGFDSEFKNKIFDLFQRLHSKEEYEGTGIGLTIVRKIVENHNGIINATGELGKGATFNIYIPDEQ